MVSEIIDATALWPSRFNGSPVARTYTPRCLYSSSSDAGSSSICETPISLLRVPRGGQGPDSEPFTYPMQEPVQNKCTLSAPPARVFKINLGTPCVPKLNLTPVQKSGQISSTRSSSSQMAQGPPGQQMNWLTNEQNRMKKMFAAEKLKTILRIIESRSLIASGLSSFLSHMHLARDIETRDRLDVIIEQRSIEVASWEKEIDELRNACEEEKQECEKKRQEEVEALKAEKDQKIDELEIRLKVYEDELKHEKQERMNAAKHHQRERIGEMRELSRKMKARVLTIRRKFRLLNFCVSTWHHQRMRILYRKEVSRLAQELAVARQESSVVAKEMLLTRKELGLVKQECDDIKKAVWNVWTNRVSTNDRRLKKLMRGLSRLVDTNTSDMQHGSKAFFEALMRHYRNSHPVAEKRESVVRSLVAVS